jgi:prepilin-type N-terminal cleavage/methylation domain-containing protein
MHRKAIFRPKGFTLVELMVVVGIIGILSAVAIPTFKKYAAKARTSEAKLILSAAYTAQKDAFSNWNTYVYCLMIIGYPCPSHQPAGFYCEEPDKYYSLYLANDGTPDGDDTWGCKYVRQNGGPVDCEQIDGSTRWRGQSVGLKVPADTDPQYGNNTHAYFTSAPHVSLSQGAFVMMSVGTIVPTSLPFNLPNALSKTDRWSIDEQKKLIHVNQGY